MRHGIWAALVIVAGCAGSVFADHPRSDVESLAGVGKFVVEISNLSPLAKRIGLNEQRLRTTIEASVRKARLPVAPKAADSPSMPILYISISTMEIDKIGTVVYSTSVQFKQVIILARDREKVSFSTTWEAGSYGYAGSLKTDLVKQSVLELVDDFINSFSEANP